MVASSERFTDERLDSCLQDLEEALAAHPAAGREAAWLQDLHEMLGDLATALQERIQAAKQSRQLVGDVNADANRPTVSRKVEATRVSDVELAEQAYQLRADLRRVQTDPAVSDLAWVRERTLELAQAVAANGRSKNKLILDAVNTDLGAGD